MANLDDAYNKYFGIQESTRPDNTSKIFTPGDDTYTYKPDYNIRQSVKTPIATSKTYEQNTIRQMADGNIDTIEQMCDILKKILNAAWGSDWGEISPDLKKGEDSSKIVMPQITAEINNREVAEKTAVKPVLMDVIKETINGALTGDSLLIYRQWFDCVVEFDFYGRTAKEARELADKFETILNIYTGYLKRQGISEIFFLKETPAKMSLNFKVDVPMKTIMYYVRFEKITPIRQSVINRINAEVGMMGLTEDKVMQVIEKNQSFTTNQAIEPAEIEFDFSNIDTGIKYNDI